MFVHYSFNDTVTAEVLRSSAHPAVAVIMLADEPDLTACKRSLKLGAYDFFVMPPSPSDVERLAAELRPLGPPKGIDDFIFPGVISRSPAMQGVYRILRRVAPTDLTVLIEGESGTGKELTAQALHANSKRADKPFYPINCAGLAESLLESELFGHVSAPLLMQRQIARVCFRWPTKERSLWMKSATCPA